MHVAIINPNSTEAGLSSHLATIHASGVAVLALETDTESAAGLIVSTALIAEAKDCVDAIILGCARMVCVTSSVREALKIPVLDLVETTATCMNWLLS